MMRSIFLPFVLCSLALTSVAQSTDNFNQFVDPFIGTGGHGHTYPGASVPFGMVQLSPDTRLKGWDGCSGYHYSDHKIYGFTHTHLSGTGCSDYGDILLMPTVGKPQFKNTQYASAFSHKNETASPGYYSVVLDKNNIKAELTTTTRTGLHKYTFSKATDKANVIIDLIHRDMVLSADIEVIGDTVIRGKRVSHNWATKQYVYFTIHFSKPFKSTKIKRVGNLIQAAATFSVTDGESIMARVGISAVSLEGAELNLAKEQGSLSFDNVRFMSERDWNKELGKLDVTGGTDDNKKIFYTAFYHALLNPNTYQDVDGKYRGRDLEIHQTDSFKYYTVFSLWDTYRALHPLLTLIDKKRTSDFILTFLKQYEQGGLLPVWELSACETNCMIGYHSVPVIADAYMKDVTGFDANEALQAMKKSAMEDRNGLREYKANGYIGYFAAGENVSRTLEYAYDDWCIAQVAKKLGKTDDYNLFIKRAQNYKNLYDPGTGFMRAKSKGDWFSPFDPYEVNHNYTEGNAWQYSFYVPQDMTGFMQLMGGKQKMAQMLDSIFNTSSKLTGHKQPDISGLIGQYAHGNEPSHQIAYMYDYAGQAWKTQEMVRRIMNEMYHAEPDGLAGNEDCGQMSAWYILSALGFYPVCPGSDQYAIGSPLFNSAAIHLENGKTFKILARNNTPENKYIQSAKLGGQVYTKSYITYDDIKNGGTLLLEMGDKPNTQWGTNDTDVPVTEIKASAN